MKKIGVYFGILGGLVSAAASASDRTVHVHCTISTRVGAGSLYADINPVKGYINYEFEKYFDTNSSQNYRLSGSNQEGFGSSARSWSSVSVTTLAEGQTKITALGQYYDRATLVGKTEVEIVLQKTDYAALGGFSLIYFKLNGVQHTLAGSNHCRFE